MLKAVITAAALVAGMSAANAAPLATTMQPADSDMVVKAHGFHCAPEWSPRWGWHRHWGACAREFPRYERRHRHWDDRRWRHERYGPPMWR